METRGQVGLYYNWLYHNWNSFVLSFFQKKPI